jgi:hypothetical protein
VGPALVSFLHVGSGGNDGLRDVVEAVRRIAGRLERAAGATFPTTPEGGVNVVASFDLSIDEPLGSPGRSTVVDAASRLPDAVQVSSMNRLERPAVLGQSPAGQAERRPGKGRLGP